MNILYGEPMLNPKSLAKAVPIVGEALTVAADADHFKVALGQVSTAKHLIETISRDYVRLLKVQWFSGSQCTLWSSY